LLFQLAIDFLQRPNAESESRHDSFWKTGGVVDFLFLIRLRPVGVAYINKGLIPTLCAKAGVPLADVPGVPGLLNQTAASAVCFFIM